MTMCHLFYHVSSVGSLDLSLPSWDPRCLWIFSSFMSEEGSSQRFICAFSWVPLQAQLSAALSFSMLRGRSNFGGQLHCNVLLLFSVSSSRLLCDFFCSDEFLPVFFFLPEIGFTRDGGRVYPKQPDGYVANRIATFFPGTRVAHRDGLQEAVSINICTLSPPNPLTEFSIASISNCAVAYRCFAGGPAGGDIHIWILRLVRQRQYATYCLPPRTNRSWRVWIHTATECWM